MNAERHLHESHWGDEDLLARLYGLDDQEGVAARHLEWCPECRSRMNALEARRAQLRADVAVPDERLRAQRQAVFARIDSPQRNWMPRLVPAGATALLLVLGITLNRPAPSPAPAPETKMAAVLTQSDRELLSDIATLVEGETPRAAAPIRGLFAQKASEVQ